MTNHQNQNRRRDICTAVYVADATAQVGYRTPPPDGRLVCAACATCCYQQPGHTHLAEVDPPRSMSRSTFRCACSSPGHICLFSMRLAGGKECLVGDDLVSYRAELQALHDARQEQKIAEKCLRYAKQYGRILHDVVTEAQSCFLTSKKEEEEVVEGEVKSLSSLSELVKWFRQKWFHQMGARKNPICKVCTCRMDSQLALCPPDGDAPFTVFSCPACDEVVRCPHETSLRKLVDMGATNNKKIQSDNPLAATLLFCGAATARLGCDVRLAFELMPDTSSSSCLLSVECWDDATLSWVRIVPDRETGNDDKGMMVLSVDHRGFCFLAPTSSNSSCEQLDNHNLVLYYTSKELLPAAERAAFKRRLVAPSPPPAWFARVLQLDDLLEQCKKQVDPFTISAQPLEPQQTVDRIRSHCARIEVVTDDNDDPAAVRNALGEVEVWVQSVSGAADTAPTPTATVTALSILHRASSLWPVHYYSPIVNTLAHFVLVGTTFLNKEESLRLVFETALSRLSACLFFSTNNNNNNNSSVAVEGLTRQCHDNVCDFIAVVLSSSSSTPLCWFDDYFFGVDGANGSQRIIGLVRALEAHGQRLSSGSLNAISTEKFTLCCLLLIRRILTQFPSLSSSSSSVLFDHVARLVVATLRLLLVVLVAPNNNTQQQQECFVSLVQDAVGHGLLRSRLASHQGGGGDGGSSSSRHSVAAVFVDHVLSELVLSSVE
eukprot:PhM_4_TR15327/c0_g1_i1/m.45154